MIGRALGDFLHRREKQANTNENVELELRNLSRKGLFQDISLQLHQGEILGIAGLVGARRTETFQSVFGYPPPDSGEVLVAGKTVRIKNPEEAIALGIGYLPEERKRQGIFPILSVLYNITIPFLKRLQKFMVMDQKAEKAEGAQLSKQLRVQTPSIYKEVAHLSGGNQQKVILARWLGSGAKILILDEPTRGIDVNAKAEIHELIYELSRNGKSIVVISSETQELLAIADRILVMHEGRISGEVDPKSATEEDVLRLAMLGMAGTTA